MSKVTAINIIVRRKAQLSKCKRYATAVDIDNILVWLNDIQIELED